MLKRMVVDGLKDIQSKVEEVEQKMSIIKAVGKAKQLEEHETALVKTHTAQDLKEKVTAINKLMDTQIEEGRLSAEEKPQVMDSLHSRRDAAKSAGKAKLLEKLERLIGIASKVKPTPLPVANIKEIWGMRKQLKDIEALEKLPWKGLTQEQR